MSGGYMRANSIVLLLMLGACSATGAAEPYHLIPGQVTAGKGPDGNTIVLDAPDGLIVVDTGRHPEHVQAILAYAEQRGKPIAAIVNTHWHLDHTTGNWDIRKAYPKVRIYASNALEGALVGFFPASRKGADEFLKSGKASPAQRAEMERGFHVMDHPDLLRPTDIVSQSGVLTIAGRRLDAHIAKFAATEGDVWVFDPATKVAIVGDLVVDIVPFMDTACPDGWAKALDEIAATPFKTLVPGHGPVMDRADFLAWRTAYDNFVKCGHSSADAKSCVEGWERDAGKFIDAGHRQYAQDAAGYYLETRLRSSPAEQEKYCKPLKAS